MTSLNLQRDIKKRTVFISACKCAGELILFSFLWFLWWLNSTWLLSSYLHDGITSRNDVMASLNMLYLSQLVDVLERWFFFCFYSILGCQVQNYHWFCIFICGHVTKWHYDVMAWLWRHKNHSVYINVWSDETDDSIVARVFIVVWIIQKMSLLDQEMS